MSVWERTKSIADPAHLFHGYSDEEHTPEENQANLEGSANPIFTGDTANWTFGGTEANQQAMRDLYAQGATDAAGRTIDPITGQVIDQGASNESRAYLDKLLSQLQLRASGGGPQSPAELMALQQGGANARTAMGLAAGMRGVSPGEALRGARESQAQGGIASEQQRNLIRIQQQQQAQQMASNLSGALRGQDQGLAQSQADLAQQAALQNQQATMQQQGMNDAAVAFYTSMGYSLEDAIMQAQIDRQNMINNIIQGQVNAQAGVVTTGIQNTASDQAARDAAAGTAISAYAASRSKNKPASSSVADAGDYNTTESDTANA